MYAGIEIGGTKLQVGVGAADGTELSALERRDVDPRRGSAGILEQIESSFAVLSRRFEIRRIGIGFGGPIDAVGGRCVTSHQIDGWDDFPLVSWCDARLGVAATLGNDCDCATLAEARFGAGRQARSVFFLTVGTGVGGGYCLDGRLVGLDRPAIAEIGHLRPGLHADRPDATVESIASGWGISTAARQRVAGRLSSRRELVRLRRAGENQGMADLPETEDQCLRDLLDRCERDLERLTAKTVAQAAGEGNEVARAVLNHATEVLGWAIAQVVTLLAPEVIVVGGGVSLIGEQLFFSPLRDHVRRYVFPPLAGSYRVVPAELGELVVVHGALARAADDAAE
jgi:glucokinase